MGSNDARTAVCLAIYWLGYECQQCHFLRFASSRASTTISTRVKAFVRCPSQELSIASEAPLDLSIFPKYPSILITEPQHLQESFEPTRPHSILVASCGRKDVRPCSGSPLVCMMRPYAQLRQGAHDYVLRQPSRFGNAW